MINAVVKNSRKGKWPFTALYASPIANIWQQFWKALKDI